MSLVMVISVGGLVCAALCAWAATSSESQGSWIGGAVLVAAMALGVPVALGRIVDGGPTVTSVVQVSPLVSLSNVATIEKTRIGLYGTQITETDSYEVVVAHEDGSYTLERIDAAGVRIMEDADSSTARIEVTRCERLEDRARMVFGRWCGGAVTTVHVPVGGIVRDFTIDPARG